MNTGAKLPNIFVQPPEEKYFLSSYPEYEEKNLDVVIRNYRGQFQFLLPFLVISLLITLLTLFFGDLLVIFIMTTITILLIVAASISYIFSLNKKKLLRVRGHLVPLTCVALANSFAIVLIFFKRPNNSLSQLTLSLVIYAIISIFIGLVSYSVPLTIHERRIVQYPIDNFTYFFTKKAKNTRGGIFKNGLSIAEAEDIINILNSLILRPSLYTASIWLVPFIGSFVACIIVVIAAS